MAGEENVEKIPSNEKPKSYVVEGATLECSCGDKECKLKTPGRKAARIQGKLQANIMDFKPKVNIDSFGKCKSLANPTVAAATSANHGRLKKMPCVPNVTMPWINGKEDTLVDGAPALLDCSINMCIWGGKISTTDDGQPKAPSRVEQGVGKMANGGMLMMIGLAAILTAVTILTAPVSVPTLLVAAGVGATTAAVAGAAVTAAAVGVAAAGAATTVIGGSEVAEGGQDVVFGALGSDTSSVNIVRDFGFGGDEAAYNQAKGIVTTTASVGTMILAPVAQTVSAASGGARSEKADSTKQTKTTGNTGGNGTSGKTVTPGGSGKSTTSALRLKSGETDAVEQTKTAANAGTRPVKDTNQYKQYPDGSIRDSKGRFVGKTGIVPGTPGVNKAMEKIKTDPKYKGYEILDTEISVKSKNGTLRRYDIVCKKPDGKIVGIEVKSGSATRTAQQRAIDNELLNNGGLSTTGAKARNAGIEWIDTTELIKVD